MSLRDKNGLTEAEFLASYRVEEYPRPSVACDMVVFTIAQGEAASYRRLPEPELQGIPAWEAGPCLADLSARGRRLARLRPGNFGRRLGCPGSIWSSWGYSVPLDGIPAPG